LASRCLAFGALLDDVDFARHQQIKPVAGVAFAE
jgi:hypothetical protein